MIFRRAGRPMPKASTEFGTPLSMGVTFAFKVVPGIPLLQAVASGTCDTADHVLMYGEGKQ